MRPLDKMNKWNIYDLPYEKARSFPKTKGIAIWFQTHTCEIKISQTMPVRLLRSFFLTVSPLN